MLREKDPNFEHSSVVMASAPEKSLGVAFERVEKRFDSVFALRRVSFNIAPSEFAALLGPNGSGKTTLLRMAALLLRPSAGEVSHPGADGLSAEEIRSRIGLVSHKAHVYDELTARENLAFFARLYDLDDVPRRIAAALEGAGLGARSGDAAGSFSRGMRQRLAIARALLPEPSMILFDEPATGLDRQGRDWLEATLLGLHAAGATLIVSTHDEAFAELAGRSIWLESGRVARDERRAAPPRRAVEAPR